MKRLPITILLITLTFVVAGIAGLLWWNISISPVSSENKPVRVVITKGKSATEIANDLESKGLIKSALAFKFYLQLSDRARSIQAGEFELSPNLTLFEAIEKLSKGPLQLWITIPEGLRREEIVERFVKGLEMDEARAKTFRSEFLSESATVEGKLFPDTYLFPRDATGIRVARRLHDLFEEKVTIGLKTEIEKSNLKLEEAIVLASIIERETKTTQERPIVAGILLNRLRIGMPLQADATAQYALANVRCQQKTDCDWWQQPTIKDLEINSPYNTYKVTGLPPDPIANPGITSIKAALSPEQTDYLYYIHESNGKIHFAKTLEEHNRNVNQYLRQ